MSQTGASTDSVAARIAEAEAVATLHRLNADYIRAFAEADTAWYGEHLSQDFVCTLADGQRIDKTEFLRRTAEASGVTDVSFDEIDVRPQGAVALVHGVTHYLRDGVPTSKRFTSVWRTRGGRWQAVAAHLTRVAED
jgi:ketosteroid isomerase-like protein